MSQKLLNTLPFFTDQNGKALDLGQVFVGVENQDPQQNPVAIYWDEASTMPAAQPLRTANGYIYRNGAESSVFIGGNGGYSLRVLDRNGRVLRNELSVNRLKSSEVTYDGGTVQDVLDAVTGPNGAASVGYMPAGDGAIATTVQSRLRFQDSLVVSITDTRFAGGAKGDGLTDDTTAIQAALNYANTQPGWVYVIVPPSPTGSEYIFTTLKVYTKTIFKGSGGVLKLKSGTVTGTGSFYPINNLGESEVVYDGLIVDGNQANNSAFTPTVCDTITCVGDRSMVINCRLTNAVDSGIMFSAAKDGRCQNNYIDGAQDLCIYINDSTGGTQDNTIVSGNICKNGKVGGGIGVKRYTANLLITDNVISDCGNGITVEDFGGGVYPNNIQVINNSLNGIGWTQRSSGPAERGISISACDNFVVANNRIRNCSGRGIFLGTVSKGVISGNHLTGYTASPAAENVGVYLVNATDCIFVGNNISGVQNQGFYSAGPVKCVYHGNIVYSIGSGMRFNASTSDCVVVGNIVSATSTVDFEIIPGAKLAKSNNLSMSQSSDSLSRVDWRVISAGQPLPNAGTLMPQYVGENVVHLAANTLWIAYGEGAAEYKQLS